MLRDFIRNQEGAISPDFVFFMSVFTIGIGAGLYFHGDNVYSWFNGMIREIRYAVNA